MSTIILIDNNDRNQRAYVCAATSIPVNTDSPYLVLRKAAEISVDDLCGKTLPHPVIICGSYSARSSAGFTALVSDGAYQVRIIGLQGFPKGLRALWHVWAGTLIPAGATVSKYSGFTSNSSVAAAMADTLSLLRHPGRAFLCEGQSDYEMFYRFDFQPQSEYPTFPAEHRGDRFSAEALIRQQVGWAIHHGREWNPADGAIPENLLPLATGDEWLEARAALCSEQNWVFAELRLIEAVKAKAPNCSSRKRRLLAAFEQRNEEEVLSVLAESREWIHENIPNWASFGLPDSWEIALGADVGEAANATN